MHDTTGKHLAMQFQPWIVMCLTINMMQLVSREERMTKEVGILGTVSRSGCEIENSVHTSFKNHEICRISSFCLT